MTEPTNLTILLSLIYKVACSAYCFNLAKKRGRNEIAWTVLGFLFDIFTIATIALLPKKEKAEKQPIKESAGDSGVMFNEGAAALNEDSFEMPKAPRLSSSKNLNWYYIAATEDTEIKGPFGLNDLRKEIHNNTLDGSTYVWCEEFEDWTKLSEFSNASLVLDADFIE